jgi:hypothetical protein
VAALSLISPQCEDRQDIARSLIGLGHNEFADTVRKIWHKFVMARPDLVNRAWPLIEPWERDQPMDDQAVRAAKMVGQAALQADMLSLTGTEMRLDTDLLGTVLTLLRPKSALQARGQYYTSSEIAELMARIVGVADEEVNDPCVGTGGMFRAAAEVMRSNGRDPADARWVGMDIDHLAVACLAVNVQLWGLGWNVLLAVGDCLADPVTPLDRAAAERRETLELARQLHRDRALVEAMLKLDAA